MYDVQEIGGVRCVVAGDDAPVLRDAEGGRALVEAALSEQARVIVVPASRIDDAFFELRTGVAGEVLQKAVNYRLRFAVVGDISRHVAASTSLRDFVVETERGGDVIFAPDVDALAARLARG